MCSNAFDVCWRFPTRIAHIDMFNAFDVFKRIWCVQRVLTCSMLMNFNVANTYQCVQHILARSTCINVHDTHLFYTSLAPLVPISTSRACPLFFTWFFVDMPCPSWNPHSTRIVTSHLRTLKPITNTVLTGLRLRPLPVMMFTYQMRWRSVLNFPMRPLYDWFCTS
jgi:hypothetical protein